MAEDRTFTAGEAGFITAVNAVTQRDWRRRSILPPAEDGWVRHSARDLCRLRLAKALIDAGIPPSTVASNLSEDFLDMMHSAFEGLRQPGVYDPQFAIIARRDRHIFRIGVVGFDNIPVALRNEVDPGFTHCIVINLTALGAEMHEHIRLLAFGDDFINSGN